ncbi:uncharacterized protein AB675_3749 [Cyphellophora attinorum]|uniref:Extracellular membrane protein CFEM domain-containing protein n=1 Tax=Cyphellophora attinorum TaxID=1664694 RepID=A0A0N0NI44_9EURO|nr:uncharacterized protein AB675_3749 [Phialophora attinorum]KPI35298.1 hypothetical protein AB675_3749 [Phialophora attinorum]
MKLIAALLIAAAAVQAIGNIDPLELAKAVIPGTEEPAAVIDEMPLPDDTSETEDELHTNVSSPELDRRGNQADADAAYADLKRLQPYLHCPPQPNPHPCDDKFLTSNQCLQLCNEKPPSVGVTCKWWNNCRKSTVEKYCNCLFGSTNTDRPWAEGWVKTPAKAEPRKLS